MSQQLIFPLMVISYFIFTFSSVSLAQSTNQTDSAIKRRADDAPQHLNDQKQLRGEPMVKASSTSHRKSVSPRKPSSITIPIKNAVVQALTPVDRNEAEAAHLSPSRHSGDVDSSLGEIIYEDELAGEMGEWIPPPPPPPDYLYRKPSSYNSHGYNSPASVPASTFQRLTGITRYPHSSSARLFGDDFALFLVILTIAGFFGLMLAMFMPFTFLLQQQPLSVSPYPTGGYGSAYGQYGYPYGRRRRRRSPLNQSIAWSRATEIGLADFIINSFFKALSRYETLDRKLDQHSSSFISSSPSSTSASRLAVPSLFRKIFTLPSISKKLFSTKGGG